MSKTKRLLSVLVAALMLLTMPITTGISRAIAEGTTEPAEPETPSGAALEIEELDPAKLNVHKLGEVGDDLVKGGLSSETTELEDMNRIVRVSIFLDGKSTIDKGYETQGIAENKSATAYREQLRKQQAAMQTKIEKEIGHKLTVKWNLTLLANAISVEIPYKDIEKIEKMAGVKSVELETQYEVPTTFDAEPNTAITSEFMVGATKAWVEGYTGAGSRVAIIDTGLDTAHISVNNDAFLHAIDEVREEKPVELMSSIPSGLNGAGIRISDKIPYAYNYIDRNTRVDHQDDASNHGSHVAGIAAANRYIKQGSDYVDAADTVGAVGMAPDAQILVMKVFGAGGGAYDSDYFSAIEDAIVLGADACNLSLGSGAPGFTYADSTYQAILNGLVNDENSIKMVLSISAGNAYAFDDFTDAGIMYIEDAHFHTGGSPGTFINSLCVAAAENIGMTGMPLVYNDNKMFYNETESTGARMATIAGTYDFVYIDGIGETAEYTAVNGAVDLRDKIVIVNRGSLSFYEKGNNLISFRPKALVIANNQAGTINMALDDYTGTFPMVSIMLKDANLIKATAASATAGDYTYYTGRITVTDTLQSGVTTERKDAEITEFSSWGVPGSLIMKPEITAPGGSIYSINGTSAASSDSNTGTDKYVSYSGTSMAAPHITGLSAIVAQYLRENPPANDALTDNYSIRAIMNSLLMSTATPMINDGDYVSILQQGAGLVEVEKAINAKSVIMMDKAYLTTDTKADKDGKVKVELGDDPARNGEYTYKFSIYNISDTDLTYTFDTDVFTQLIVNYDGALRLYKTTMGMGATATYEMDGEPVVAGHDVNRDGETNDLDAGAILDYLTGEVEEEDVDLTVADLDNDGEITSADAHALLNWTPDGAEEGYVVPAHQKRTVTVTLKLDKADFDEVASYTGTGVYIEGFTYATCETETTEGASLAHEHTIPILGYYGSWTDPEMFDTNSYTENLYGNEQLNYSGKAAADTNYLTINNSGKTTKFSGNPYVVEEEFPEDRLAISRTATIKNFYYNLIRPAAGTGFAISKLDAEGNVTEVLASTVNATNVYGAWYYVNGQAWQDIATKSYAVNKLVSSYGVADGDRVRVGFYSIPELNVMKLNSDLTAADAAALTNAKFQEILAGNELGKGAFVGFDFTVDSVAPEFISVQKDSETNPTKITVEVSDDRYLAFVGLLSVDGSTVYAGGVPEQTAEGQTVTYTLDVPTDLSVSAVALVAGDYAGNEVAGLIRLGDGPIYQNKTVYMLTDTLEAGHDYIISNVNAAGSGYALTTTSTNTLSTATPITVVSDENGTYIDGEDVLDSFVFTSSAGIILVNKACGGYLGYYQQNQPYVSWDREDWGDSFSYRNHRLTSGSRGMAFSGGAFIYGTPGNIYLYVATEIQEEYDPSVPNEVVLNPTTVTLIPSIGNDNVDLVAQVMPITLEDRSVDWTSSDTSIATVDNGHVKALGPTGTVTITAASHMDPTVFATATIYVVDKNPMDIAVNGQVTFAGDMQFAEIDLNDMSTTKLGDAVSVLTGGGQGGDYIYGNDTDGDYLRYAVDGYVLDEESIFAINPNIALLDGANLPTFTVTSGGTDYTFNYNIVGVTATGYVTFMPAEGTSVSYFDFSGDGGPFVAITFVGYYNDTSEGITYYYFYALGADGHLYILAPYGVVTNGSQGLSAQFGDMGPVNGLPIDEDLTAYSMTYARGISNGTYDGVILADNTTKSIYYIDTSDDNATEFDAAFVGQIEGATNVAALYDNYFDSITALSAKQAADLNKHLDANKVKDALTVSLGRETKEAAPEEPVAEPEVAPEEAIELPEVAAEEPEAVEEPVVEPEAEPEEPAEEEAEESVQRAHILNKVIGGPTDEPEEGILFFFEDENTTNGLFAVTLPEGVNCTETRKGTAENLFVSIHNDTEKGVITVAYAMKGESPLFAGTPMAGLALEATTCGENAEAEIRTLERNNELDINEEGSVVIPALDHIWGEPSYVWEQVDGAWKCTATAICERNDEHVLTETVTGVRTEEADKAIYTATFENELFEEQVKEVEIGYYLVGLNGNWAVDTTKRFTQNPNNENNEEYLLTLQLAAGDSFKAVRAEGTTILTWYPADGGNYVVDESHAGLKTVYFRPNYDGGDDWHFRCLYILSDAPVIQAITVVIEGHHNSPEYNGQVQSVDGYDVTILDADNNPTTAYTTNDFTFTGTAHAEAKDENTQSWAWMGLTEEQFTNTNPGFDVSFDVTDGYIEIVNAELGLKIDNKTKAVGEEDPVFTVSVNENGCSDGAELALQVEGELERIMTELGVPENLVREEGEEPGTYTIRHTATPNQLANMVRNYNLGLANGTLTITAHEHTWSEPTWTWKVVTANGVETYGDGSQNDWNNVKWVLSGTATFTCECGETQSVTDNELIWAYVFNPITNTVDPVIEFTAEVEFNDEPYVGRTAIKIDAGHADAGYYLYTEATGLDAAYRFVNKDENGDYVLETELALGAELFAVKAILFPVEAEGMKGVVLEGYPYKPEGTDIGYITTAETSGQVKVYFNPEGKTEWESFFDGGYIFIEKLAHEHTWSGPTWTWKVVTANGVETYGDGSQNDWNNVKWVLSGTATFTCECGETQSVTDNELTWAYVINPITNEVESVIEFTAEVEFNDEPYVGHTAIKIDAGHADAGYYLYTEATGLDAAYRFVNKDENGDYVLETELALGAELFAVKAILFPVEAEGMKGVVLEGYPYKPEGTDTGYVTTAETSGQVKVYFNPEGKTEWESFFDGGYIFIEQLAHEHTWSGPTWTWKVVTVNGTETYGDGSQSNWNNAKWVLTGTATFTCECGETQSVTDEELTWEYVIDPVTNEVMPMIEFEAEVEFNGEPYVGHTVIKIDAGHADAGYYLYTEATGLDAEHRFVNKDENGDYVLETELALGAELFAVKAILFPVEVEGMKGVVLEGYPYKPEGTDTGYVTTDETSGFVKVYFNPEGKTEWESFFDGGYIFIEQFDVAFMTHSLMLDGSIGVRFYMRLPKVERFNYEDAYMEFSIDDLTGRTEQLAFSEDLPKNSKGYYGFTFYVSSVEMAEDITAVFHYKVNGEDATKQNVYSVKQYCIDYFNKPAQQIAVANLVKALADYGHYAQRYLSATQGWTIGEDFADMDLVYHEYSETDINSAKTALADYTIQRALCTQDIQKATFTVAMDSKTALRVYVTPVSGYTGTLSATIDGEAVEMVKEGSRYMIEKANIPAHLLSEVHTIVVTSDNGTSTITVSGLSFAQAAINTSKPDTVNVAVALYRYSLAADTVVNNNNN